jgi:hypothetical protein
MTNSPLSTNPSPPGSTAPPTTLSPSQALLGFLQDRCGYNADKWNFISNYKERQDPESAELFIPQDITEKIFSDPILLAYCDVIRSTTTLVSCLQPDILEVEENNRKVNQEAQGYCLLLQKLAYQLQDRLRHLLPSGIEVKYNPLKTATKSGSLTLVY